MTAQPPTTADLVQELRDATIALEQARDDWRGIVTAPTLEAGQQRTIDVLRAAADRLAEQDREVLALRQECADHKTMRLAHHVQDERLGIVADHDGHFHNQRAETAEAELTRLRATVEGLRKLRPMIQRQLEEPRWRDESAANMEDLLTQVLALLPRWSGDDMSDYDKRAKAHGIEVALVTCDAEMAGDRTLVGLVRLLAQKWDEAKYNRRGEYELRTQAEQRADAAEARWTALKAWLEAEITSDLRVQDHPRLGDPSAQQIHRRFQAREERSRDTLAEMARLEREGR